MHGGVECKCGGVKVVIDRKGVREMMHACGKGERSRPVM